jgi:enterochelin esterase-like enzyme
MFRTLEVSNPEFAPPGLRFVTVKSAALGQRADVLLFVPPQAAALEDVPLVLLLHGVYGSHSAWAFKGGAHLTAQRLIDAGEIPPLVLAMPSDGLWGDGSGCIPHAAQDFERWIVDEVPAAARAACSACSAASPLCIAGLSMGGFAALRLAGRYPQRFVAAAGHSSVTEAAQLDALIAETRAGWATATADQSVIAALRDATTPLPALRFDCGRDDPFIAANRQLHAELQAAGIAHSFAEHDGGHGWDYWAQHLEDTLRFFASTLSARSTTS